MHVQNLTLQGLAAYHQLVPVVLRVGIGLTFFFAGLGKVVGGVDNVARFFASLGIPLPGLMGPLIAYVELLGGLALLVGVLTRLFSLLFLCNMAVALLLAGVPRALEAENIAAGFSALRVEVLLLLGSAALALLGAGRLSIDAAVFKDRPVHQQGTRT